MGFDNIDFNASTEVARYTEYVVSMSLIPWNIYYLNQIPNITIFVYSANFMIPWRFNSCYNLNSAKLVHNLL